ncbi:MAG: alpha/beta hydrolase [Casimicrobium sp.]
MKQWTWLGDDVATAERRADLQRLLGPLPALTESTCGVLISTHTNAHARVENWTLTLNREELVPGLLMRPLDQAALGLVLYCHAHGNRFQCGKDELLVGRPALQAPPYGEVLTQMGFAVLAIDHWCFGERNFGGAKSERAMVKRLLWDGKTLWGYRVHDTLASLQWARTQPGLAVLPVTALGLSMGSTMAIWAAALDATIDTCIDLCCLAEYDALIDSGGFDQHGEYFFVPGLRNEFAAAEICALIAPRPHLSLVGRDDPLTPSAGVQSIDNQLRAGYASLEKPQHWQQKVFDCGHQETAAMRSTVVTFLQQHSQDFQR